MIKTHAAMPRNILPKLAFLVAGVPLFMVGTQAHEQKPLPDAPHRIVSHRCGGVGDDSLKQLKAQAENFNLGFWMVGGPGGAYLADVQIQIQFGALTVASFNANGPLCYVKLPAGRYTVTGTHSGQTRTMQMQSGSMNNYLRW